MEKDDITQSNGKVCQLVQLQIIALFFFCRMIATPAAPPGPFTGHTTLVRPALSLMVFHFLWGRNEYLTVSMVMNISSLKGTW